MEEYYIIRLEEGIYLRYFGGWGVSRVNKLSKAHLYRSLKTATNMYNRLLEFYDKSGMDTKDIKILKVTMVSEEI